MPDTETTLTPDQVAEIEARRWVHSYGDERLEADESTRAVLLQVAERDALCRSLRAAWAEAAEWEKQARLNQKAFGEAMNENTALGQQLATQAESITEFQENEKKLKAQLKDGQRGLVIMSALINFVDWLDTEGVVTTTERGRGELVKRFLDAHQEGENYFMQAEQIANILGVPFSKEGNL